MSGSESLSSPSSRPSRRSITRWILLLLMLLAFARLIWHWDMKSLWWDESLSLQRAESPLPALIVGQFAFDDGLAVTKSIDQHPFVYFLLLGGLIRFAGESDFALRFPSAAAATLLVPMAWTLARLLARKHVVPPSTSVWAALLVALNPFFLWYGREARMYTLVPLFALMSTYWLLRWTTDPPGRRARLDLVAYFVSLALLLGTHYLSILILPAHAVLMFLTLAARNRRLAVAAATAVLGGALLLGLAAARLALRETGSGSNFLRVPFPTLVADLLNAFSLGLSVDLDQVRALDYLFATVALLGLLWAFRRRPIPREAWLLPAFLIAPVLLLHLIQQFQPAYMNARHMSLISGAFAILVAAGVGTLWKFRRWAGGAVAIVLVGAMMYSTANYFTDPQYARDNFAQVGADLAAEMLPGDGVVLSPPQMIRLYQHYLPLNELELASITEGADETWRGWSALPQFHGPFEETEARLKDMLARHPRVWLVASGMVPLGPNQDETRTWFESNAFLARDLQYSSNTLLWLKLYLPKPPILPELPETVENRVSVVFGDKIRLDGYDIGKPLASGGSIPITLYWQPLEKIERRYKHILRLVSVGADGMLTTLAKAEHEPYKGSLPTSWWSPGPEIFEYVALPAPLAFDRDPSSLRLAIEMYDAETLEKLPVTSAGMGASTAGDITALMSYTP